MATATLGEIPKVSEKMQEKPWKLHREIKLGLYSFVYTWLGRALLFPRDREGIANLNSKVDQIKLLYFLGNEAQAGGSAAVKLGIFYSQSKQASHSLSELCTLGLKQRETTSQLTPRRSLGENVRCGQWLLARAQLQEGQFSSICLENVLQIILLKICHSLSWAGSW